MAKSGKPAQGISRKAFKKEGYARRALYNNLDGDEELAVLMDEAVKYVKKADWNGNKTKEREIKKHCMTF